MRFLCLILFWSLPFSQGMVDGIVAIVGNNIILHSDVLQQTQVVAAAQRIDPAKSPYLFEGLYIETLENIINQFAVLDVAEKDTNLIISDDEVDRALEQRIDEFVARAGSVGLFEASVGMPLRQIKADYWREIRNMMLIERYKFSTIQAIDVSRMEVDSFYINYKDSIPSIPENYTFSVIEVPYVAGKESEKEIYTFLDSLRNLVVSGRASFDSLAVIYSQDPGSASSGGNLGFTARGTLVHDYEKVAYSLFPGELSPPVRSQFGYHLIRLVDRLGEEISSQHILLLVSFSDADRGVSLNIASSLYQKSHNDPFVFDSLSVVYNNTYNNFSGTYSKVSPKDIPYVLINHLKNQSAYNLSLPIETDNGYILIYLYNHNFAYVPTPNNSWNLIYQYAKQEKQNRLFQNIVSNIKNKTYIKNYYR